MKCYLLLRDNVESGPYNLAEMETRKLVPTDLIWVEGYSGSWRFPAEIPELAPLVQHELPQTAIKTPAPQADGDSLNSKTVFVALPPQPAPLTSNTAEAPILETLYEAPLFELKEKYEQHLQQRTFHAAPGIKKYKVAWMAALCAGLLAGAFMIKKMVDGSADKNINAVSAAALTASRQTEAEKAAAAAAYRNALATELVPVDTMAAAPKVAKKKVSLKKLVSITANDYKKGVFGGINKLSFNIRNRSEQVLDKVTVEVAYLKPNGEVVKKETHYVKAVAPKSSKTLEVPPSNRGVDIKYKITNIKAHEAKAAMREL